MASPRHVTDSVSRSASASSLVDLVALLAQRDLVKLCFDAAATIRRSRCRPIMRPAHPFRGRALRHPPAQQRDMPAWSRSDADDLEIVAARRGAGIVPHLERGAQRVAAMTMRCRSTGSARDGEIDVLELLARFRPLPLARIGQRLPELGIVAGPITGLARSFMRCFRMPASDARHAHERSATRSSSPGFVIRKSEIEDRLRLGV